MARRKNLLVVALCLVVGLALWLFWPDDSGSTRAVRTLNRVGVDAHPDDGIWRQDIDRLRRADPAADADRAIKDGDTRLLGLWGDRDYYPGLEGRLDLFGSTGLTETLGTRMFEKTSDAIVNDTQFRYIHFAEIYAEAYNTRLVGELERLGKLPRPDDTPNE